ncbi:MAG TPA: hypothetical protein VIF57_01600 [Polyangia bacterium]|jgi:hypothetical protein
MRTRIAHRLVAASALLSLLAVSAATGGVWLRCRITGVLRPACCCPAADGANDGAPTPATAESDDDCCDRIVTEVERAPSELASRAPALAPALVLVLADVADAASIVARPSRFTSDQSRAGPASTRTRLLAKSALLI